MKATHTGRLKSLREILSALDSSDTQIKFCLFIDCNQDKEIEFEQVNNVDYHFDLLGDIYSFRKEMLTDLREIKPEIEIPKTPFYVQLSKGCHDVPKSDINIHFINSYKWTGCERMYNFGTTVCPSFNYSQVAEKLNNGTWTICEAPEKVMIPWTDEDWKEWFLNDGKVIDNRGADDEDYTNVVYLMIHGLTPDDEDQFYYMGKGEWLSKETFLREFLDRHGNKFEKEA